MNRGRIAAALAAWMGLGCATTPPPEPPPRVEPPPAPAVTVKLQKEEPPPEAPSLDPGATLIARERDVWTLEGMLVAEADAAMRSPEAQSSLGDRAALAKASDGEDRAREYVRAHRSAEVKKRADALLASLDLNTRALLDRVANEAEIASIDVLMDYLTFDGLTDLALMRAGHRRWKWGLPEGPAKQLADSFFAQAKEPPSAKLGIAVLSAADRLIEISVFGCRVTEAVHEAELVPVPGGGGVRGKISWSSNYENLRRALAGQKSDEKILEHLEVNGPAFNLSYRAELDEYLATSATRAWALGLYHLPANELADLWGGVAQAAGLPPREPGPAPAPVKSGTIGDKKQGLTMEVAQAKRADDKHLLVTLKAKSTLPAEVRVPSSWFELSSGGKRYREIGLGRAALAAQAGKQVFQEPFALVSKKKPLTTVLVFEVPAELTDPALHVGEEELVLAVPTRSP